MKRCSVLAPAAAAAAVFAAAAMTSAGPSQSTHSQLAQSNPARASDVQPSKLTRMLMAKDPTSNAARRAQIDDIYNVPLGPSSIRPTRGPSTQPGQVIYGDDDRVDVYAEPDPVLRELADSTAVVVSASSLTDNGNGTYSLAASPWTSQGGTLCPDEPFRGQLEAGFCSSFLVGSDIIVTAGHCVDNGDISSGVAFVFGFYQIDEATNANVTAIPADNVYFGDAIIDQSLGGGLDHSVVRIDREVVGRNPVPIRRQGVVSLGEPLVVIGNPSGLTTKIAGGAIVRGIQPTFIESNLDTYGGNSGSAVFNANTLEVEGILVRGATDFVTVGGCVRSNVLSDTGSDNEDVSRVDAFASFIPELGLAVSPGGSTLHVGPTGGPFTPASVDYTLANPTSSPIDYSVSFTRNIGLTMNGSAGPITGQLVGNGQATITVDVPAGFASAAAGLYADTIEFEDITNGRTLTRDHTVEIGQSVVDISPAIGLYASGPLGGPFAGTQTYTVANDRPTPTTVRVTADQPWITINGGTGPVDIALDPFTAATSEDVTVSVGGDAQTLGNGIYSGEVTFENLVSGEISTRDITIDVGRYILPSQDTPITISDNTTVSSTVTFQDVFCVGNIEVDVDISHTFRGDLTVELVSPEGTVVRLHNRSGGTAEDIVTTYADSGATAPEGPGMLGDFNGESTAGDWTLIVSDNADGDTGSINTWALRLSPSGDACAPNAISSSINAATGGVEMIVLEGQSRVGLPLTYTITALPSSGQLWEPGATSAIQTVPYLLVGDEVLYRADPNNTTSTSFGFVATDTIDSDEATVGVNFAAAGVAYFWDMNTDPAWSGDGQWAWGIPTGGGTANGDPTSGHTGNHVMGYNLGGDYANSLSAQHMISGAIDCSDLDNVRVRYMRWLGVERSLYDDASFAVSTDGTTWDVLYTNPDVSFSDDEWVMEEFDVASIADGASTLFLRWTMGSTDSSVTYPGWNVDDVAILATAPPACIADVTTDGTSDGIPDGSVTLSDFSYYLSLWSGSAPLADMTTDGTSNGVPDGSVTLSDFSYYLSLWSAGCP